ncbi:hypothetical protein CVT26_001812 [Gymnopilus dilepis]|uniref:Uncharacterized protein n=1 Tax=Gymnopilus dilepis TaxID=231916 RepID=A0A409WAW5_9AGAR|nr:hypothetical protein CVT26_001812 [Gymnopilus dilepis]
MSPKKAATKAKITGAQSERKRKHKESTPIESEDDLTDPPDSEPESPTAKRSKTDDSQPAPDAALNPKKTAEHTTSASGTNAETTGKDGKEEKSASETDMLKEKLALSFDTPVLTPLRRVAAWTQVYQGSQVPLSLQPTSVVDFNQVFDAATILRLRKLEVLPMFDKAINIATADPESLAINGQTICAKGTTEPTHFFALGTITKSSIFNDKYGRQVSVLFSNRSFPRMMAVLGAVYSEKVLFTKSFYGGVVVNAYAQPPKSGTYSAPRGSAPSSPVKAGPKPSPKRSGAVIGYGEVIPAFDGRKPFPTKKVKLPSLTREIHTNAAVLVTFTVSKYAAEGSKVGKRKHLKTAVSFNIQSVIYLADAASADDVYGAPTEPPFGVRAEPELELVNSDIEMEPEKAGVQGSDEEQSDSDAERSDDGVVI